MSNRRKKRVDTKINVHRRATYAQVKALMDMAPEGTCTASDMRNVDSTMAEASGQNMCGLPVVGAAISACPNEHIDRTELCKLHLEQCKAMEKAVTIYCRQCFEATGKKFHLIYKYREFE